jgi:hypothetical protein
MADREPTTPKGPEGPNAGEIIDAAFGWNLKVLRGSLGALLVPVSVCRAALAGDDQRYAAPVRAFILLFGISLAITGFFAGGQLMVLETLTQASPALLDQWAAPSGEPLSRIDDVLSGWSGLLAWPLTIVSSSPYILLLKAYRPSRTFYGHALVYIITNNAALTVQIILIPAMALVMPPQEGVFWSTLVVLVVYAITTARVVFALYADTFLGGLWKLLGILALTPITLAILSVLQLATLELILQLRFDLSLLELMALNPGDPA